MAVLGVVANLLSFFPLARGASRWIQRRFEGNLSGEWRQFIPTESNAGKRDSVRLRQLGQRLTGDIERVWISEETLRNEGRSTTPDQEVGRRWRFSGRTDGKTVIYGYFWQVPPKASKTSGRQLQTYGALFLVQVPGNPNVYRGWYIRLYETAEKDHAIQGASLTVPKGYNLEWRFLSYQRGAHDA